MYVISSSNKRTDYPVFEMESVMNGVVPKEWNLLYKKGQIDILMTNIVSKSHIVRMRGCIYENTNPSLTSVMIGSTRIPIVDVNRIGKKGNKTIVDIKFLLSSSNVMIVEPKTWSFSMFFPVGFEVTTLISDKSTIGYVLSLVEAPIAVGLEISPVSFTLMWPEGENTSTVLINDKTLKIESNRVLITAVPDTTYICDIDNGTNRYKIDVVTPCASVESYRLHYRTCKKQIGNGYIYDLTDTDPTVIFDLRKHGIIGQGDTLLLRDQNSDETYTLKAVGNGGTICKNGSFYIIPSFETEEEQCVCMETLMGSKLIKFDRTESFVKYDDNIYTYGDKFSIGDQMVNVVKGSIILILYDDGPGLFPGGATTASQVLTSGDVVMRDLIMRSSYQVTEKVDGDYTYGQTSFFMYNSSANSTQEATRVTHFLDDGQTTGGVTIDVLYTPSTGSAVLHRSVVIEPSETTFTTIDSTTTTAATFDTNGLRFNSNTADVYFGESQDFRIHYEPASGNDPSMLQIQGYDSTSDSYITRQLITNEPVN